MRATIFLLFSTVFSINSFAQNFSWAQSWGAQSYDRGNAVATDLDGNVYSTGTFRGTVDFDQSDAVVSFTSVEEDIFITKTNPQGALIWARHLSGSNAENSSDIEISANGDVYITGTFNGIVDFDPGNGTFIMNAVTGGRTFICKLNSAGAFVWAKQFSGTTYTDAITLDGDNNVYAAGNFAGESDFDPNVGEAILSGGLVSMFVAKLDVDGNYLWAKHFAKNNLDTLLTSIYDIAVDEEGNVYTTGGFEDTVDFDPGTGVYELFPQSMDIFISKLDANGNFVWVKKFGSVDYDRGISLALDDDANIYTVGSFSGIVDFDPGAGTSALTSGIYNGPTSYYVANLYLSKYDTDGNFSWVKGMVGVGDIIGTKIAINGDGEIYTGGYFNRTVDLDPGTGQNIVTTTGTLDYSSDIFVTKLDDAGNLLWAKTLGSENHDLLNDLTVDASNNLYITGDFERTVDFNPGIGVWELSETNPSSETYDAFLAKFSECLPGQSSVSIEAPCNEDYVWAVNNEVYLTSGIYHYVTTTIDGCDSIVMLDLEIPLSVVEYENVVGTLTYSNPQPNDVYQWVDCSNDNNIEGATAFTFTPEESGSYALTVTNGNCSATSPCIPFTFVGLEEHETANMHLFPNPVADEFTISIGDGSQLLAVEVTTLNGKLIYNAQNPANTFSVQAWETGIYLVKVVSEKGNHTFRVIKN